MTTSTTRRFAAAAVLLVLLGLALGWQPMSASGTDCGSTFYRSQADGAACDRAVGDRRPVVFVLIAAGVGAWAVRVLAAPSTGGRGSIPGEP
jgi:hypothetical protein